MESVSSKQVVVSGIGIISSLGNSREQVWGRLISGESGLKKNASGLQAPISDFVMNGAKSRVGDFAQVAAEEALRHAGLDLFKLKGSDIGVVVSQSKPIISDLSSPYCEFEDEAEAHFHVEKKKKKEKSTSLDPQLLISSFTGYSAESVVKNTYQFTGPSANPVAACATGVASLQMGHSWIQSGQCSMVLAGASESSLHPLYRAGFEQMGVLTKGEEKESFCPFDKKRSGFVMGEGASVLLLEERESAERRGHQPLAVLQNVQLQHGPTDTVQFDSSGESLANLIIKTIKNSETPGYINAHGTGTQFNDRYESRGIKRALGKNSRDVPVSSTKAATGHLLGAAGAMEASFAVLSLRDQIMPPTLNYKDPDPECDLDCIPNQSRKKELNSTLSLSYGFGGQMGAVLFGPYEKN